MGLAHAMTAVDFHLLADSFVLQTVLIGVAVTAVVWSFGKIARLQVIAWVISTILIFVKYGISGQLVFYSNDQLYHESLVSRLVAREFSSSLEWWIFSARAPYVLPATLFAYAGINPVLALKMVSLASYLCLTEFTKNRLVTQRISHGPKSMYWTALGLSGGFFSVLALRETSMMLATTFFLLKPDVASRFCALFVLVMLRPHLAVALFMGWLIFNISRRLVGTWWDPIRSTLSIGLGTLCGYSLYILGSWVYFREIDPNQHRGGLVPVSRIASNFVGLQFLTANPSTLEQSLTSLLLYRIVFSETVLIPTAFVLIACLGTRLSNGGQILLWSFAIYVGLATSTDFNSFRQNLSFMPAMGVIVLDEWRRRQFRIGTPLASSLAKPSQ